MNKEQEKKMDAYWYLLRGAVTTDDYITATVLINEVKIFAFTASCR